MDAAFRPRGGVKFSAALTDLTHDGGCIETGYLLDAGSDGWLQLPTLADWEARVVWHCGSRSGLAFAKPFHSAVMAMLMKRAEGVHIADQGRHTSGETLPLWARGSRRRQILAGVVTPVHFRPWKPSADRRPAPFADRVSAICFESFRDCIGGSIGIRLRGRSSQAVIVDILRNGITVKSPIRPYIGETVAIELLDTDFVQGTVIWWEDGCFAIRLVEASGGAPGVC